MHQQIDIEPAQPKDATAIFEVHYAAVRQTAAPFYSEAVINSWASPLTNDRIDRIRQSWIEDPHHHTLVAKQTDQIVGFGSIDINGKLLGLYVHPSFGRQGIGAKILAVLEQEAVLLGAPDLHMNASLNAEAFYRKQGFEVVEYATHQLNSGQEMACVKMRKTLSLSG